MERAAASRDVLERRQFLRGAAAATLLYYLTDDRVWASGEASDHMRYARQRWGELEKHTHGFYVNDMTGTESSASVNANYGKNYPRLVEVKSKYDPHNLFRLNANVKPT